MGNDIFPRGNHIVGALFWALLCAASASGATIKWTGGGDGTTWGNGDNWGGTAPGAWKHNARDCRGRQLEAEDPRVRAAHRLGLQTQRSNDCGEVT